MKDFKISPLELGGLILEIMARYEYKVSLRFE